GSPFRMLQKKTSLGSTHDQLSCSIAPMCLSDHVFTMRDHDSWAKECQSIMSSWRARAALLHGGFAWRVTLQHIGMSEAIWGPSGIYTQTKHNFSASDSKRNKYVDDELMDDELDVLCGIYKSFMGVGNNMVKLSWYPLVSTFQGSGENNG
ncbi:hypothetical protein P691DRAFT_669039, partial [Macrolepiota fuliginosa MF-IS2]